MGLGDRKLTRRDSLRIGAGIALAPIMGIPWVPATLAVSAGTDLAPLEQSIQGRLLKPGAAAYGPLRTSWNGRWSSTPLGIVQARSAQDVAIAVVFARQRGIQVTARSGGHSFVGASLCNGLVIDLSAMNAIVCDPARELVRVGGGARIGAVRSALYHEGEGQTMTTGSCDSVGISGLTLGGGFDTMSRVHGLTIDAAESARVVLADGSIARADDATNPELFWALRGGGGGFGIVVEWTFRTRPWASYHGVRQVWNWESAPEAFAI